MSLKASAMSTGGNTAADGSDQPEQYVLSAIETSDHRISMKSRRVMYLFRLPLGELITEMGGAESEADNAYVLRSYKHWINASLPYIDNPPIKSSGFSRLSENEKRRIKLNYSVQDTLRRAESSAEMKSKLLAFYGDLSHVYGFLRDDSNRTGSRAPVQHVDTVHVDQRTPSFGDSMFSRFSEVTMTDAFGASDVATYPTVGTSTPVALQVGNYMWSEERLLLNPTEIVISGKGVHKKEAPGKRLVIPFNTILSVQGVPPACNPLPIPGCHCLVVSTLAKQYMLMFRGQDNRDNWAEVLETNLENSISALYNFRHGWYFGADGTFSTSTSRRDFLYFPRGWDLGDKVVMNCRNFTVKGRWHIVLGTDLSTVTRDSIVSSAAPAPTVGSGDFFHAVAAAANGSDPPPLPAGTDTLMSSPKASYFNPHTQQLEGGGGGGGGGGSSNLLSAGWGASLLPQLQVLAAQDPCSLMEQLLDMAFKLSAVVNVDDTGRPRMTSFFTGSTEELRLAVQHGGLDQQQGVGLLPEAPAADKLWGSDMMGLPPVLEDEDEGDGGGEEGKGCSVGAVPSHTQPLSPSSSYSSSNSSSNSSSSRYSPAAASAKLTAMMALDEGIVSSQQLWLDFLDGVSLLQGIDLKQFPSLGSDEKLCLFLNLYHCLMIHAFVVVGLPKNMLNWADIFRHYCYDAFGDLITLSDLKHCIIRKGL